VDADPNVVVFEYSTVLEHWEAQNMAIAFGGDATAPATLSGLDVSMNEYRFLEAQYFDKASRSHSSPIARPKSPKKV
jgi:hypothetical protein